MAGVNKVILVGNLGADPEVRHLEGGSKVAKLSIATSERYTNKNGEKVDQTEWHRVELWDRLADLSEQYLKKGNTVYIEGKIRTSTYQDKEGVTRYDKRIRATNMTFVGGRSDGSETDLTPQANPQSSEPPVQQQPAPSPPSAVGNTNVEADDLPF